MIWKKTHRVMSYSSTTSMDNRVRFFDFEKDILLSPIVIVCMFFVKANLKNDSTDWAEISMILV